MSLAKYNWALGGVAIAAFAWLTIDQAIKTESENHASATLIGQYSLVRERGTFPDVINRVAPWLCGKGRITQVIASEFAREVTDSDALALNELPWLDRFVISNPTIAANATFRNICRVRGLRVLYLAGSDIGDNEIAQLSALTRLEALNLDDTNISDIGVKHLLCLRRLRSVSVVGTKVTAQCLRILSALPMLRQVNIDADKVPLDEQRTFKNQSGGYVALGLVTSTSKRK